MSIKFNYETGVLVCNAPIGKVESFIQDIMGRLNRVHCHSSKNITKSEESNSPLEEAQKRNLHNARMLGIKTTEQWEHAITGRKLEYWHIYLDDNTKLIPSPFEDYSQFKKGTTLDNI